MTTVRSTIGRSAAAAVFALLAVAAGAPAQDSSLFGRGGGAATAGQPRPMTLHEGSWTSRPLPEVPTVKINSLVTVLVDEKSMVISEGELDRKKKAHGEMILKDWVLLKGLAAVIPDPASLGDPKIRGEIDNKIRADGSVETRETMEFKIACRVVDIRPNGNLILEAHREIQANEEIWNVSLTGEIRPEDVLPNNTVLSENIADMRIHKREQGEVRNSYRSGWLLKFLDKFQP